ncbi:MAG TPA: hypothetical protein VGE21_03535 [Flavobacteriales bacterium]
MHRSLRPGFFLSLLLPAALCAQNVQWVTTADNNWTLNPVMPVNVLCAGDPDHVYEARLDEHRYLFGSDVYGSYIMARRGLDGTELWNVPVGDSVIVTAIASNAEGTVVLGGRYFDHLRIAGGTHLFSPPSHVIEGTFLCSWNAAGELLWVVDASGEALDDYDVAAIAVDPQGDHWAALSTFFGSRLVHLGADGSFLEERPLENTKVIGGMSFDPWGGLYVAGAASVPDIGINGTTFPIEEQYAFFVTRMDANGTAQWLHAAHDITFQRPSVVADATGHAFLAGPLFDTLSWGDLHFEAPDWNTTFFLTRLDSMGTFEWGRQPDQNNFAGQFALAQGRTLGVDGAGHVYVLGTTNGELDWGNGVVTDVGTNQDQDVTLLSFDTNGDARWELHGGSDSHDVVQELSVLPEGICHFIGTTGSTYTLGGLSVDPEEARASVTVRVDGPLSTGLALVPAGVAPFMAVPSVFSDGFRLRSDAYPDGAAVHVVATDALGRRVGTAARTGELLGMDWAAGTYQVQVKVGEAFQVLRVIKQHH